MSIRILKQGLADTIQDGGRYGYQHLGINPGGAMDGIAMRIVNALVGNAPGEAVLEMHFPAATLLFEEDMLVALSGADMGAVINGQEMNINQPVIIDRNSTLRFTKRKSGARGYLAVQGGFETDNWLQSSSTHLKVKAGGYKGRALKKEDVLKFKKKYPFHFSGSGNAVALPWRADIASCYTRSIRFVPGKEYELLIDQAKQQLVTTSFAIHTQSDRMGYRLNSEPLQLNEQKELISTAVTKGTMQLLPNGQLIVLMADHQTTGGYPRVGYIISADIPSLAQMNIGDAFSFEQVPMEMAETLLLQQELHLQQIQNACTFRLEEYFSNQ